jgi:hypothetical protein
MVIQIVLRKKPVRCWLKDKVEIEFFSRQQKIMFYSKGENHGTVVALDLLPDMMIRVKAKAENAGVSDPLVTLEQGMKEIFFQSRISTS